jgi:hypothetical protein
MTALLWARPVFLLVLIVLTALYVWSARRPDEERER